IGGLLRGGVVLSAAVTVAGGGWHLAQVGSAMRHYHTFRGPSAELRSGGGVLRGVAAGHSEDLIQLGLLLLIATPIARVALSVYTFAEQGDRVYVVITLIVLGALVASLAGISL